MRKLLLSIVFVCLGMSVIHADIPKPTAYIADYAGLLSPATTNSINAKLANFERATSIQFLVVSNKFLDGGLDDTCNKLFHSWGVGQKGTNNGVVLFWFTDPHRIRVEVGYGLEGSLPDAVAKEIIETQIVPNFKQGKWDAGVSQGVDAIIAATKGEYKGTGKTDSEKAIPLAPSEVFVVLALIIVLSIIGVLVCNFTPSDDSDSHSGSAAGAFIAGTVLGGLSRRRDDGEDAHHGRGHDEDDSSCSSSSSDDSSSSSSDNSFSSGGGDSGGGGADGGY